MANYFRCDVDSIVNPQERMYSVLPEVSGEYPNGIFGYLGERVSGSREVRKLLTPTAELIKDPNARLMIVSVPEVIYDQHTKASQRIGLFRNKKDKPLRAEEAMKRFDGVVLSEDYFDVSTKSDFSSKGFEEGDTFILQPNMVAGTQLKYTDTADSALKAANVYKFVVVDVRDSEQPAAIGGDGTLFPASYKEVVLDIVRL